MSEEQVLMALRNLMEAIKAVHETNNKQKQFNEVTLKTLNVIDQELEMLKVAVGELSREVKACRT